MLVKLLFNNVHTSRTLPYCFLLCFPSLTDKRIVTIRMTLPPLIPSSHSSTDALFNNANDEPSASPTEFMNDMLPFYEEAFTTLSDLCVSVCTYNVASKKPDATLRSLASMRNPASGAPTDVVVLAFQEVDMSTAALLKEETDAASPWIAAANALLGINDGPAQGVSYAPLPPKQMVGLLLCVYVRYELVPFLREHEVTVLPTGALGSVGNKGAVGLRIVIHRTSICFLSAHLAAGQDSVAKRNASIETILQSMDFNGKKRLEFDQLQATKPLNMRKDAQKIFPPIYLREQDIVVIAGDLNYRLNLTYEEALQFIKEEKYAQMFRYDQLLNELKNPYTPWWGFRDLTPCGCCPSYRFDIGTNTFDTSEKKRIPGFTDRCCVYMKDRALMDRLCVDSQEVLMDVKISDHKPLVMAMRLPIRTEIRKEKEKMMKSLLMQYEQQTSPHSLFRTTTTVSATSLDFGSQKAFDERSALTLSVQNTGGVVAVMRVVRVIDPNDTTDGSWLRVSPIEMLLLPGQTKKFTVSMTVDPARSSWLGRWKPFAGLAKLQLASKIVIAVRSSNSHTVQCTASLNPSVFGNQWKHLYTLGDVPCSEAYRMSSQACYSDGSAVVAPLVAKEVWALCNAISRNPHRRGLFLQSADPSQLRAVFNQLDEDPEKCAEVDAVIAANCLLFLLKSLDPIIPGDQYSAALEASKGKDKEPMELLNQIPAICANTFIYIISLLQFLLQPIHARRNGLTREAITSIFSGVIFRQEAPTPNSVSQQQRSRMEEERDLLGRFIDFFLNSPSPILS